MTVRLHLPNDNTLELGDTFDFYCAFATLYKTCQQTTRLYSDLFNVIQATEDEDVMPEEWVQNVSDQAADFLATYEEVLPPYEVELLEILSDLPEQLVVEEPVVEEVPRYKQRVLNRRGKAFVPITPTVPARRHQQPDIHSQPTPELPRDIHSQPTPERQPPPEQKTPRTLPLPPPKSSSAKPLPATEKRANETPHEKEVNQVRQNLVEQILTTVQNDLDEGVEANPQRSDDFDYYKELIVENFQKLGVANPSPEMIESVLTQAVNLASNRFFAKQKQPEPLVQEKPRGPETTPRGENPDMVRKMLTGWEVVEVKPLRAVERGRNKASIVTFSDGTKQLKGFYKPVSGTYVTDSGGGMRESVTDRLMERETFASDAAQLFEMGDLVPVTVSRDLDEGPGSVQEFVPGTAAFLHDNPYGDNLQDLVRAAAFDFVLGMNDRHSGNWLLGPDGRIILIDHGYTVPKANKDLVQYLYTVHNMDFPDDNDALAWQQALATAPFMEASNGAEIIKQVVDYDLPVEEPIKAWGQKEEAFVQLLTQHGFDAEEIAGARTRLQILQSIQSFGELSRWISWKSILEERPNTPTNKIIR